MRPPAARQGPPLPGIPLCATLPPPLARRRARVGRAEAALPRTLRKPHTPPPLWALHTQGTPRRCGREEGDRPARERSFQRPTSQGTACPTRGAGWARRAREVGRRMQWPGPGCEHHRDSRRDAILGRWLVVTPQKATKRGARGDPSEQGRPGRSVTLLPPRPMAWRIRCELSKNETWSCSRLVHRASAVGARTEALASEPGFRMWLPGTSVCSDEGGTAAATSTDCDVAPLLRRKSWYTRLNTTVLPSVLMGSTTGKS